MVCNYLKVIAKRCTILPSNTSTQVKSTSCPITNAMSAANKGELKTKSILTFPHPTGNIWAHA